MLTDEAFRAWCQHNQIAPETAIHIQRIRSSQPVRKVRSGISNVTGRYPSVKMGVSIQLVVYLNAADNISRPLSTVCVG
jgi:putative transposase